MQLIAFGNGQCSARGHRKVPTKQIIRHQASILLVMVVDEFGTSSRCPECKHIAKLKSSRKQNTCLTHITTPQVSQGDISSQLQSMNPSDEDNIYITDTRIETCQNPACRKVWNHDEVSVVNLAHVICAMLQGRERLIWLDRASCHGH